MSAPHFIGIDIGTSSVKALLIDDAGRAVASHSVPLTVERPRDGWSEQAPEAWWQATVTAIDALANGHRQAVAATTGIGLSGQMHGAVLLDEAGTVLRPAILWNDGRSAAECAELEERAPALHRIAGNAAMPGFTAPKLLWVARHAPETFARTATVLLPKDYVRFRLSGELATDLSDASGTLWLDVGERRWSPELIAATGLPPTAMPRVVEGTEPTGTLAPEFARRWGMARAPVIAGGAGDNAASAIGLGAIQPGDAFLSLGTSGVLWITTERFQPDPSRGVHAFCHAVPGRWHQMGVILSATAALGWAGRALGMGSEAELLARIDRRRLGRNPVLFAPYLSGERTPHNDPAVRAGFTGLGHATGPEDLALAVVEGVAFAFADCLSALTAAGSPIDVATVVGGGSRSALWVEVLANVLDLPLHRVEGGETGAALGAARLGAIAAGQGDVVTIAHPPALAGSVDPDADLVRRYRERHGRFRHLYAHLKEFAEP
ncbi:MAG: xylulokinase [Azospirillaceae bacterium]